MTMSLNIIQDSSHKLNDKRKVVAYIKFAKNRCLTTLSLGSNSLERIKIYHSELSFIIMNRDSCSNRCTVEIHIDWVQFSIK